MIIWKLAIKYHGNKILHDDQMTNNKYLADNIYFWFPFLSWTRDQAIEYMSNYTASGDSEISFEVNRYISLPGQACAYKIGELKLWELRNKSSKELGKTNVRICLIRCCSCCITVTRLVSLLWQELLSFQNTCCTSVLSGVRVALYLVLYVMFCQSMFVFFLLFIVLSVIRITTSSCKKLCILEKNILS